MIYLFNGTGPDAARLPLVYNGLTINDDTVDYNPRTNQGTEAFYEVNIAAVDEQWDAVTEPKVANHGMEAYEPFKINALIRLDGFIRAASLGVLMDAVRALNEAFDPVNAFDADSSDVNTGFLPLTFSIPTADLTNYATGFITAEYFVRSLKRPVARTSEFEGLTCKFSLFLQAVDPRCYYTVAQTGSRSDTGTLVTNNSLAGFPSWPIVTFTGTALTVAGVATIYHTMWDTAALRVTITGLDTADVLSIDMEQRTIKLNGVLAMSRYVSGTWPDLPAASVTWTFGQPSGVYHATIAVNWGRAL